MDIDMSKRQIRSSGMPAFVHTDTYVPARQAHDFHSAAARLLWKTLFLRLPSRSNYTKGYDSESYLPRHLFPSNFLSPLVNAELPQRWAF